MIQSTMCSTQKLHSVVCKTMMRTTLNYKQTTNRTTQTTLRYTTLHFFFLTSTVYYMQHNTNTKESKLPFVQNHVNNT